MRKLIKSFKNNKATSGSVLYYSESICTNCTYNVSKLYKNFFFQNRASSNGAIYLSKKSNLYSYSNRFIGNEGKKSAVYYIDETKC